MTDMTGVETSTEGMKKYERGEEARERVDIVSQQEERKQARQGNYCSIQML